MIYNYLYGRSQKPKVDSSFGTELFIEKFHLEGGDVQILWQQRMHSRNYMLSGITNLYASLVAKFVTRYCLFDA